MKQLAYIFFFMLPLAGRGQASFKDLAIIQNNTGIKSAKAKDMQSIFRAKYSRWPQTQEPVTIVLPSSKSPIASTVATVVYKTSLKEMQKFWLSLVFQGRANPPVYLDSDALIKDYVLKNPGSIGVISAGSKAGVEDKYLVLILD